MNYLYLAVGVLAFLAGVAVDPTPPQSELLAAAAYLAAGGYVMLGVGREIQAHRQRRAGADDPQGEDSDHGVTS